METGRCAGKMKRSNELTRRGRGILRLMPALSVGQNQRMRGNCLGDRQMAGVTDSATIGVGRPIVVVDLFGNGGCALKAGKEGQQQQYEDGPYQLPPRDRSAHHCF
jgi:hypothetical protein